MKILNVNIMLLMVLNIFQEKILNIGLYIFSYRVAQEQKSLKYHGNPATCKFIYLH